MRISKPLRRLKMTGSFSRALKALSPGGAVKDYKVIDRLQHRVYQE